MKTVLVLCLLCATAYAFPSISEEESNESDFFQTPNKKKHHSVVEVDSSVDSGEDSFFFPAFFRPILVNPFSQFSFGGFSNLFPISTFKWSSLFNMFGRVPEGAVVTNATSTVKVVNGQKVTVNVTTYEKDGAVFKYEVVEVVRNKPEGEDSAESEQPIDEKPFDEKPTYEQPPEGSSIGGSSEDTSTVKAQLGETIRPKFDHNSLDNEILREEYERNNWEFNRRYRPRMQQSYSNYDRLSTNFADLSNDIRVNDIAEAAAINSGTFQISPDVEVFSVPRPSHNYRTISSKSIQYRRDFPQNWNFNFNYHTNTISRLPYVKNVQYYKPQSINHFKSQPLLPPNAYNYQHTFGNPF